MAFTHATRVRVPVWEFCFFAPAATDVPYVVVCRGIRYAGARESERNMAGWQLHDSNDVGSALRRFRLVFVKGIWTKTGGMQMYDAIVRRLGRSTFACGTWL